MVHKRKSTLKPEPLLKRALAAIRDNRLSLSQVLLAAQRNPAFAEWLKRKLRDKQIRIETVMTQVPLPTTVLAIARRRLKGYGAISIHIGRKRRHGKLNSNVAIVVTMPRKTSRASLRASRTPRIPPAITIKHKGKRRRVVTDVVVHRSPAHFHANADTAAPGSNIPIGIAGETLGALGAVISLPNGQFGVTAGHVARLAGSQSLVTSLPGTAIALGPVVKSILDNTGDIALFGPITETSGLAGSETVLRDPSVSDVQKNAWVMVNDTFEPIHAVVDGVGVAREFSEGGGLDVTIANLVKLTPPNSAGSVSRKGDSGAPVLDDEGYLIAFVVGADNDATYAMPARGAVRAL